MPADPIRGEENSDNLYAITKRKFEDDYRDKIAAQVSMIPGVVVGVNVELNPETSHITTGVEYKGKPFDVQTNTFGKVHARCYQYEPWRPTWGEPQRPW